MLSSLLLVVIFVVVFLPSLVTHWGPLERDPNVRSFSGINGNHWFGTDQQEKDLFARVLYGGQISLKIGIAVALVSGIIGSVVGAIAGYYGKWLDNLLMRVTDLFLAIPGLVALILLIRLPTHVSWLEKFMGHAGSVRSIITALSLLFWMPMARVVRGVVLSLKEKEFIESARAIGASDGRILGRHLLPNCIGPIIVNITLSVAGAILTETALSFLGLGVQSATVPTWGNLIYAGKSQLRAHGTLVLMPGLAITIVVLAVNFLGDGLRDALDPRQGKNKA
jgi:peptide/nickel transport system permease protein